MKIVVFQLNQFSIETFSFGISNEVNAINKICVNKMKIRIRPTFRKAYEPQGCLVCCIVYTIVNHVVLYCFKPAGTRIQRDDLSTPLYSRSIWEYIKPTGTEYRGTTWEYIKPIGTRIQEDDLLTPLYSRSI